MPLEPAETRPRVESSFSKVQSAKLNTDEIILMAGTEYTLLENITISIGLERKSLSYSDPEALWTKIKSLKQPYLATKGSFTPQKRSKKTLLHQGANFPASMQRSLTTRDLC